MESNKGSQGLGLNLTTTHYSHIGITMEQKLGMTSKLTRKLKIIRHSDL